MQLVSKTSEGRAVRTLLFLAVVVVVSAPTHALAQFDLNFAVSPPPPGTPMIIQSGLYDNAILPPGRVPGVDVTLDFVTSSPPTPVTWNIFETLQSDCTAPRPPTLPPSATSPQPLGATLVSPSSPSVTAKLLWPATMSAAGTGNHCLAVQGCAGSVCRVVYAYFNVRPNPPSGAPPRAFPMHTVTTVEGNDQPVGSRLFVENTFIAPPLTPSNLCVKRCPQFPGPPTGNCNSSCGATPSWIGFDGDTLTWTFQPPYGARGPWEFAFTHPNLDNMVAPTMNVDVLPANVVRPSVKEAVWAADFGGPYRIPLENLFKEEEARNDDINTAPYFDRGYLSGEIEPAGDVDAFIFHVGTNEFHRFTTRRRGVSAGCVFPASLKIFDISDRLPTTTLASVLSSATPVASATAVGTNGCAMIDTLALDNQSIYLFTIEHRDGAVGYDYVIHHEVFAEEVEDEFNTSVYSSALRAEPLFEPGVIGTLSSGSDVDWGWVHLQTGNVLKTVLSRIDGTCTGLSGATLSVTADDGTVLYTSESATGAAFIINTDGCPEGEIIVPAFDGGEKLEARYNIAVTGATGQYRLSVDRRLSTNFSPPPKFENELLDINAPGNALKEGTCAGVSAFLLDDYAEGASFFGAFATAKDPGELVCGGFGGDVAVDPYGICREVNALALNDPEETEWDLAKTPFGLIAYTSRPDASDIQVVAMAADAPPAVGNAAGLSGGLPAVLQVTSGGEFGNDFYYDPYGECDLQTYPSPACKGDAATFIPPPGAPNFCRIDAPKRFREGQRIQFEMTRWNRTPVNPSINPVSIEVLTCESGTCTVVDPSVAPTYDFDSDLLAWDIPYDFLDEGGGLHEVQLNLTYAPAIAASAGGIGPSAEYHFNVFVEDLPDPGSSPLDVGIASFRLAEPLARTDLDTRAIQRAFAATSRAAARHSSDSGYFQFATNTSRSRVAGIEDRIQLHPQFENGRLTQGSGPPQFEVLVKNRGATTSPAGTARVFLVDASVDSFGNFTATPPTGESVPYLTMPIPSLASGGEVMLPFRIPSRVLLGVSGSEPWIAASKAFFIQSSISDDNPANNLYGPVFATPARPPQACEGCAGDPGGGFAGAYSSSKDITGVIASMKPSSPKSGDLVTVNVQVQFSGTGFTDDGIIRFYVDQEDAPTGSTTPHQSATFPTSPTPGTVYGYAFTFTADKPISGLNELPIRVYLDATNQYTEPGSGEANNQLPTNSTAETIAVANSSPTFPSAPVTTATEDILWTYEVQVADADTIDFDRLSVSLVGPPGMAFQDALITCAAVPTRKCVVVEWVPEYGDGGDHPVSIEACDGDPVVGGDGGCSTQDFTVTVVEVNDDPVFTSAAPATTATEDTPYSHVFTATDEESAALSWSLVTAPAGMVLTPAVDQLSATLSWTPTDTGVGAKSVQVRITDGDGAAVTTSWTITTANVNDAPVLETASGSDLIGSEGVFYSAAFTITDVDNTLASQGQTFNCDASSGPAFLTFSTVGSTCVASGTPTNASTGAQSVFIRVRDSASPEGTDVMGYTLTIADVVNATPVFAAVPAQVATEDVPFTIDLAITDDDFNSPGYAEDITFTLDGAVTEPAGIIVTDNGTSVNLTWTPSNDDVGANLIKVIGTDRRGASASRTFTVTVANVNDDPIFTAPANATLSEGATYSSTLVASDPDGDPLTFALVGGAPPGFTVSAAGAASSGVTNDAQVGVWTVVVEATDGNGGRAERSFVLTVNNVEESPSFAALANQSTNEDSVYSRLLFASDPDPGDSVTFAFAVPPPPGMTLSATTGELEWDSPTDDDVGVYTISISATDQTGNSVTRNFDLTVVNVNDAPVITSAPILTATEEVAYTYVIAASDDDTDSGDSLTFSATTLPSWLAFNAGSRTLSGTPDDGDVGVHPVVLRVEDESGAFDTDSFSITVAGVNDAPVLTTIGGTVVDGSPLSFTVNEGNALTFGVFATDIDSATLTYSLDLDGNSFSAMAIDPVSGAFTYTPTFDEAGTYVIYIVVTDEQLSSDVEPVTIDVSNVNRAPVFAWSPDTTATEDVAHTDTASATDPDGDTVTYSLPVRPTGMTIGTTTGTIAYLPGNADVGARPVTVRATDSQGLFTDRSYTLVVANVNDAPVFTSSPALSVEEESLYSYVATATDDDGNALTFSAPTLPAWMTFSAATRTLSGTPDDPQVGPHSVVIRANDGQGGGTNQSFTITVSPKNDAPTLVAPTPSGTISGSENTPIVFSIAATDPDGPALTYSIVGLPAGATLNGSTGAFSWTPGFDDAGSYPMTLRASDGSLVATRAVTLNVTGTDRPPTVSAPPAATTDEGVTLSFAVTGADADGDSVVVTMPAAPSGATFVGGTFSWTPNFLSAGTHVVTFRATSNSVSTDTTTTITVNQVNQAPTLGTPSVTAATQGSLFSSDLVATDIDLGVGDVLTFTLDDGPTGMTVSKIGNATARLQWTPAADQIATYNVTLRVEDSAGEEATRSFDVAVSNVNDAPVITSSAPTAATQGVAYSYTLTFSDADSGLGDVVTRSATTLPSWLAFNPSTGALTGIPANADVGSHPVVLRVQDLAGAFATQAFTVVVANVNDAPTIAPLSNQSVDEGQVVSFSVVATDIDGAGPTLTAVGIPAAATFSTSTVGAVTTGSFSWTTTLGDEGAYAVTFTASDGTLSVSEAITISVGNVNQSPTLAAIGPQTVDENAASTFTVTATDPDAGTTLVLSAVGGSPNVFARGAAFSPSTGAFSWTPSFTDAGSYSVTFSASDGALSDSETVIITVVNVNRAPVFVAPTPSGTLAGTENAALSFTVAATDADSDTIVRSISGLPTGAVFTPSTGVFSWTPNFSQSGVYPLTLSASDGITTTTRALSLNIANTDRNPTVSAPATQIISEGQTLSFAVTANDPDGDSIALTLLSGPSSATFAGGQFSWTPGFDEPSTQSALFRAVANGKTVVATTTITVLNTNRAPVLGAPSSTNATQGSAFLAVLVATDADLATTASDTLSFSLLSGPSNATLTGTTATSTTVSWTPTALDVNPATRAFTVRVSDASGGVHDRAFDVTVTNVNDPPTLTPLANVTVTQGETLSLTLDASDLDATAGLPETLTYSLVSGPAGMTVDPSTGALTWATSSDSIGTFSVTVRVQDAAGAADSETFSVTVTNLADDPVFVSSPVTVATQGDTYSYTAVATDPDIPSGDAVTLSATTRPSWLTFTPSTGLLSGTPSNDDVGSASVVLLATDATGRTATQAFTISVGNINDAPVIASLPTQNVAEGALVSFAVSASDPDNDLLTVTYASADIPAAATFDGTTFAWQTTFSDEGSYTATFTATDGSLTTTRDVTIVVGAINRAPVLATIADVEIPEGQAWSLQFSATDPDGDPLTYAATAVGIPSMFTLGASFDAPTRTLTWSPDFTQSGVYEVLVTVNDGALSDSQTFFVTVTDVNRAPTFSATPPSTIDEDTPLAYTAAATDLDGDSLTWSLTQRPNGMTIGAATGILNWTPRNDDVGTVNVTIRVDDGRGGVVFQAFTLSVLNTNDAPTFDEVPPLAAVEDSLHSFVVTATDVDVSDVVTLSSPTLPGWLAFDVGTGALSGTPDDGDVGAHPVQILATDLTGATATLSFTVSVTANNDLPTFVAPTPSGTLTVVEGASLLFTVAATDPDGPALTFGASGLPVGATLNPVSGDFAWTPSFNSAGTYLVTLIADDSLGTTTQPLTIVVTNSDRPPTIVAPASVTIAEGSPLAFTVQTDDPDGDVITLTATGLPAGATLDGPSGAVTWTPPFDAAGDYSVVFRAATPDAFVEATTQISVSNTNRLPRVTSTPPTTATEDVELGFVVSTEDLDGDVVAVSLISGPANAVFDALTSTLTWTPLGSQVGTRSFSFRLNDGNNGIVTETALITVLPRNDAPVFSSTPNENATEDVAYLYDADAFDEDGDVVTFALLAGPAGMVVDNATGEVTWTPTNDDVGTHSVELEVRDLGPTAAVQTFDVTVLNVNDAPRIVGGPGPIATPTRVAVLEGSLFTWTPTVVDDDVGDTLTLSLLGAPAEMVLDQGTISWTPENADVGETTFTVRVRDSAGAVFDLDVTVVVQNLNNAPFFLSDAIDEETPEDALWIRSLLADDVDAGDEVTLSLLNAPLGMTLEEDAGYATLRFLPQDADVGTHDFIIRATDTSGGVTDQAATLVVTPVNDAPILASIAPQAATAGVELRVPLSLVAPDPDGPVSTFALVNGPATSSVVGAEFRWTPAAGDTGLHNVVVSASDSIATDTESFVIVVGGGGLPPALSVPADMTTNEGVLLSEPIVAVDASGTPPTLTVDGLPDGATLTTSPGQFTWVPTFRQSGTYPVVFHATNAFGTTTKTWIITVLDVNRAPVLVQQNGELSATESLLFDDILDATDLDDDFLSFTLVEAPAGMTIDDSGTFNWIPTFGQLGLHPLRVSVADGRGGQVVGQYSIRVHPLDVDNDSLPDTYEVAVGLDPTVDDSAENPDGDGLVNLDEFREGTDPFVSDAPFAPTLFVPANDARVPTATPTFSFGASSDPNGFAIGYRLVVRVASTSQPVFTRDLADVSGTISVLSDVTLTEGVRYEWFVTASSLGGARSSASRFFLVDAINEAPPAPLLVAPFDDASVAVRTPTLRAYAGADPEGETTRLVFSLRTTQDGPAVIVTEPVAAPVAGGEVAVPVPELLENGSVWLWNAYAIDSRGLASEVSGTRRFTVDLDNLPPSTPTIISPTAGEVLSDPPLVLVVSAPIDPEGLPVETLFELDTDPSFQGALRRQTTNAENGEVRVVFGTQDLPTNPDGIWFWRITATDGVVYSSPVTASFVIDWVNEAPSAPALLSPEDNSLVLETTVVLRASTAIDPEGVDVTHRVELTDATGTEVLASQDDIRDLDDGEADLVVTAEFSSLVGGTLYGWRVVASDGVTADVTSPLFRFRVDASNERPAAPELLTPADGAVVDTARPIFTFSEAVDPDGDELTHDIEIWRGETLAYRGENRRAEDGIVTVQPPMALTNGEYLWRARGRDPIAGGAWAERTFTVEVEDLPDAGPADGGVEPEDGGPDGGEVDGGPDAPDAGPVDEGPIVVEFPGGEQQTPSGCTCGTTTLPDAGLWSLLLLGFAVGRRRWRRKKVGPTS